MAEVHPLKKLVWFCVLFIAPILDMSALTLEELRKEKNLTPETFAALFSDFKYKRRDEVLKPGAFLKAQEGDCDDYATLAALVLREKGYTPHLIAIRIPGEVHVVCYIEETKTYLDYNYRSAAKKSLPSDGSITDLSAKVARSFNANWTSASEFTFREGVKRLVYTVRKESTAVAKAAP